MYVCWIGKGRKIFCLVRFARLLPESHQPCMLWVEWKEGLRKQEVKIIWKYLLLLLYIHIHIHGESGYRIDSAVLPADGYFAIAFHFQPAHKALLCLYHRKKKKSVFDTMIRNSILCVVYTKVRLPCIALGSAGNNDMKPGMLSCKSISHMAATRPMFPSIWN